MMLALWAVFTGILWAQTLNINISLFFLFGGLTCTFALLSAGVTHPKANKVGLLCPCVENSEPSRTLNRRPPLCCCRLAATLESSLPAVHSTLLLLSSPTRSTARCTVLGYV